MTGKSTGVKSLRQRVRDLEIDLARLRARVDAMQSSTRGDDPEASRWPTVVTPPPKRGPKFKMNQESLISIRDQLIPFLELNWPNLEIIFRYVARMKAADRIGLLEKAMVELNIHKSSYEFACHHLVKPVVVDALCEFIKDRKRYHGDPRSIANALAGAEKIAWRTSLDACE